jgi:tRNA(Phe) wybutosine-synthesizing methylase Tyw3
VYSKCESQLRYLQELEGQVQKSVSKEEYDRLRGQLENSQQELFDSREQMVRLRERFEKQLKELEESEKERKT